MEDILNFWFGFDELFNRSISLSVLPFHEQRAMVRLDVGHILRRYESSAISSRSSSAATTRERSLSATVAPTKASTRAGEGLRLLPGVCCEGARRVSVTKADCGLLVGDADELGHWSRSS